MTLLGRGANIYQRFIFDDRTLLHQVAMAKPTSSKMVLMLLEAGADMDAVDDEDNKPDLSWVDFNCKKKKSLIVREFGKRISVYKNRRFRSITILT